MSVLNLFDLSRNFQNRGQAWLMERYINQQEPVANLHGTLPHTPAPTTANPTYSDNNSSPNLMDTQNSIQGTCNKDREVDMDIWLILDVIMIYHGYAIKTIGFLIKRADTKSNCMFIQNNLEYYIYTYTRWICRDMVKLTVMQSCYLINYHNCSRSGKCLGGVKNHEFKIKCCIMIFELCTKQSIIGDRISDQTELQQCVYQHKSCVNTSYT